MGSVPAAAHFLGKKCQYNVSGSDSVRSISAVILYVTMWLIFLGNARSPGVQSPTLVAGLALVFLGNQTGSVWVRALLNLVWVSLGWTGDAKIDIHICIGQRIFLELVNYVVPGFSASPLLRSPAGCQESDRALFQHRSPRCALLPALVMPKERALSLVRLALSVRISFWMDNKVENHFKARSVGVWAKRGGCVWGARQ